MNDSCSTTLNHNHNHGFFSRALLDYTTVLRSFTPVNVTSRMGESPPSPPPSYGDEQNNLHRRIEPVAGVRLTVVPDNSSS